MAQKKVPFFSTKNFFLKLETKDFTESTDTIECFPEI